MPTYDYRCQECGFEFEQFQSITAKVLKKCPQCKKNKLDRLIGTGAAVIFKGSGFYQTDYRSDSYTKGKESEKSKTSESKSETKTQTNGESKEKQPAKKEAKKSTKKKTS